MSQTKDALKYRLKKNLKKHLLVITNLCIIKIPTDASVERGGIYMCAARRLSESERKNEIMNSAVGVITQKGLENATMEEIIAGTSLSKGGVYHYYKNVNEIFKDIMLSGIEYRKTIIKDHMDECKKGHEMEFMAKQFVDKIIDDNPYMPLYVEFLIAKKRNPELEEIMHELQKQANDSLSSVIGESRWSFDTNIFNVSTDVMNALILASNILGARENFKKNRCFLERMFLSIFKEGEEN